MTLASLLEKIDENQAKINAHGKFDETILKKINYKFRLDWNYYSNRMEGGTLTREETRSVMIGNISVAGKPIKDVMEMNGHDKVVLDILKIGKGELRLSEKRIKEIHKAIMHEEDPGKAKEIGQWKSSPNEIINYRNEKIPFTPPSEVPERMHVLLSVINSFLDLYFQDKKDKTHPLFIAADFHLDYVSIHPFYDGNGRTARIFTNLLLISCGLPVIIIKDEHKDRYYRCLADIQAYGGDAEVFRTFIAERVVDSQMVILNALSGKEIEEPDDLDKRITLLKKKIEVDDVVVEGKNAASVQRVFSEIVFPLFNEIEAKCAEFNEYFMQHISTVHIANGSRLSSFTVNEKSWDKAKQACDEYAQKSAYDISLIEFQYNLRGSKKNINGQALLIRIIIRFNPYNYYIVRGGEAEREGLKKTYDDVLTIEEKKQIIKKVMDPMLSDIERYVENK